MGLAAHYQSSSDSTRKFTITVEGDGINDEVYYRRVRVVAIPYSDFEENGCDDNQTAQTTHTGAGWTDSDTTCSATPKDADYLLTVGGNVSNENATYVGHFRMNEADTNYFTTRSSNDQSEPAYTFFTAYSPTWTSGASRTVKVQGSTTQTAGNLEAEFGINGYVNVFRLDVVTTTTSAGYRTIIISHLDENGLPRPECMGDDQSECLPPIEIGMVDLYR
jgi:hypothetical protein